MLRKAAEVTKIVGLCILASVVYGILHDQITARVYLPYFTVWHPHLIDSTDPTVVAFFWGFVATWWVGLFISIPLSFAAVFGDRPMLSFKTLAKGVCVLLLVTFVCATAVLYTGYVTEWLIPDWVRRSPETFGGDEEMKLFSAVLATHNTSYTVGALGGMLLCVWVSLRRKKMARGAVA